MAQQGSTNAQRSMNLESSYLPNAGFNSNQGGGTYTSHATEPTVADFTNVFGPVANQIKDDLQRYKRHGRWHLPDILQGPNPWLADRVDGLITDATNSPFTSTILPYRYFENVDGKIVWNQWSFDEAMPSRVPYEAAARTLTQTKRSFEGYAVRHGLAITLEHNFMMTPQGRENFNNQLLQMVGSIQYANDYDVHMALILAPSYEKFMLEKYNNYNKSPSQTCREYIDLFGFMQKNPNALDILIEEAKLKLKLWGGPMPNFMLTNSKLTFQLTMTPERTNYITQGIDGVKRLRNGPDIQSYRGVSIIPSRSFSLETGQVPRDMLRRRVRVAEYYRIPPDASNISKTFELYNEDRDTFFSIPYRDLFKYAKLDAEGYITGGNPDPDVAAFVTALNRGYEQADRHANRPVHAMGMELHKALEEPPTKLMEAEVSPTSPLQEEWNDLLGQLATRDLSKEHAIINPLKLVAHKIAKDLVFAPFAVNLHFSSNDKTSGMRIQSFADDESSLQTIISKSMASYPRTNDPLLYPKELRHPITKQEVTQGSLDYNEARVLLGRLFHRYAAPTSVYKVDKNNNLIFNNDNFSKANLSMEDLYLQPLGAFNEPNHPLHYENLPLGNTKQVHESWILTQEVLAFLHATPRNAHIAASIAASFNGEGMSRAEYSAVLNDAIVAKLTQTNASCVSNTPKDLAVYTWTASDNYLCSNDYLSPHSTLGQEFHQVLREHAPDGIVTNAYLRKLNEMQGAHPWLQKTTADGKADTESIFKTLQHRIIGDAYDHMATTLTDSIVYKRFTNELLQASKPGTTASTFHTGHFDHTFLGAYDVNQHRRAEARRRAAAAPAAHGGGGGAAHVLPGGIVVRDGRAPPAPSGGGGGDPLADEGPIAGPNANFAADWEFVIIRPNIEHYMLGIIMGLAGEQLGNTLWGQTELSVYDDSQHGVWGMSYKYHERAMVFNEKNLIRLWDIAYDGYNGGKDDTYVDWTKTEELAKFKEDTNDLTKDYHGRSMMVFAFHHPRDKRRTEDFQDKFKTNWPSPINFYQKRDVHPRPAMVGAENQAMIATNEYNVFDPAIYPSYYWYQEIMPDFRELHEMRKSASQSVQDDETAIDCLAFQGTMRIKQNGVIVDTINGSGHHGPDYIGVSSVRAGKGYKVTGGITQLVRQI